MDLVGSSVLLYYIYDVWSNKNKIKYSYITDIASTKFRGLIIDKTLSRKNHINQLLTRLSCAYCAVRTVIAFMSQEIVRIIYLSCVHSCITIFWGNSPYSISIVEGDPPPPKKNRIIMNSRNREPCKELFKHWRIFSFLSRAVSYYL